ncbi:DUF7009 family protein [Sinomicrobium oceani]|uniref:DUF7009 family protein n=1 Tax=Sinomicrobium oceani TaxID=1150368 RepID=UPI00227BF7CA|nr:hypothetical protein [Sinomicrobium oceani]
MKIRIKGNSIRYRLTKTEVETFSKTGTYKETADFGHSVFSYVLKAKKGIDGLEASFKENTITLYLTDKARSEWAASDRIGFSSTIDLPNGKQLLLLLEKDFACLDNTTEDQTDNYPNPKSDSNAC